MSGGDRDSSLTRVNPIFNALLAKDPTGRSWIGRLLRIPECGAPSTRSIPKDLAYSNGWWGQDERPLDPPLGLLSWLVRNFANPEDRELSTERGDLLARRPERIEEALRMLRRDPGPRAWYILEGPTYPDVVLETSHALIVIEGKRTEAGPTTRTTWMPGRHQMLRHIDAAWEIRGHREVFGFFIVEGDNEGSDSNVPAKWQQCAKDTISADAIESSLPHRSPAERAGIVSAFLGVTTWQALCDAFDLDRRVMIEVLPSDAFRPRARPGKNGTDRARANASEEA